VSRPKIAVLGAGIMGSSVSLFLTRHRFDVTLIDAAPQPFRGASRWNEGKIHLGYLYGADETLATARKLIPGGLVFRTLLEDLLSSSIATDVATRHHDRYLIHRDSVASVDQSFALATRIAELTRQHPHADRYFVSPHEHAPRRLTQTELDSDYDTSVILGGIEVPERSVATAPIADAFVDALNSVSEIEQLARHRIQSAKPTGRGAPQWFVNTTDEAGMSHQLGPFDGVVNALWEGRIAVDASVGLSPPPRWTHRYRVSVFAKTRRPTDLHSAVVAVGPFGDVKNYDGRQIYVSWYDTGLLAEGKALAPPPRVRLSKNDEQRIATATFENLGRVIPALNGLLETCDNITVRGGWVYAAGQGALSDADSELHRRDRVGITTQGTYFSVDTGKYSIAPWLAQQVADRLATALGR